MEMVTIRDVDAGPLYDDGHVSRLEMVGIGDVNAGLPCFALTKRVGNDSH